MPALEMDIHRLAALVLTVATITGATVITNDSSAIATSFEYIIVGGGTTGLAIANRLSVKHTVLVVERGDDEINNEVKLVIVTMAMIFTFDLRLLSGDQQSIYAVRGVSIYTALTDISLTPCLVLQTFGQRDLPSSGFYSTTSRRERDTRATSRIVRTFCQLKQRIRFQTRPHIQW